jgi:hypothetical protein
MEHVLMWWYFVLVGFNLTCAGINIHLGTKNEDGWKLFLAFLQITAAVVLVFVIITVLLRMYGLEPV